MANACARTHRSCLDHGMSDGDIRTTVNVFGDRFTWMMLVARKRNLKIHIDRLTKLIECDKALKTGAALEPFHVIEKYVYQQTLPLVQRNRGTSPRARSARHLVVN